MKPYVEYPYSYAFGRSDKQLKYLRIGDLLTKTVDLGKDKIAFISEYENIIKTFNELNEDTNKLAKGLNHLDLKRGDVVGIWSCNSYSWIQVQYACAKLGLILCAINPVYKSIELNYVLRKGQIKALFMPGVDSIQQIANDFQNVFNEALEIDQDTESGKIILKEVIFMDGIIPNNTTKYDFRFHSFNSLVSNDGYIENTILSAVTPDDPAIIMFTSGTTGKPKGAVLSHFSIVNNALLIGEAWNQNEGDITLCVPLPFFHIFAFTLGNVAMSAFTLKEVIPSLKYSAAGIVESIVKYNCTHIIATPTQLIDILDYLESNKIQINSLKLVIAGGAPVPIEVFQRMRRIIVSCDDIRAAYGATELAPGVSTSKRSDTFEQKTETVGSPLDFVEVKVVNTSKGKITKIGEKGELLVRGHNVMVGYWRDELKTKEAFDEGKWYKTGDLSVMDSNGFIKIIGRTKDMIIRGGENIYPREVEELLHSHPLVFDAYVFGVPDPRMGEEVCAWVQLKDKNSELNPEDIRKFCKTKISYFKVPRYVIFVDGFPMTPTRKAQKFIMREESCKLLGLNENITIN